MSVVSTHSKRPSNRPTSSLSTTYETSDVHSTSSRQRQSKKDEASLVFSVFVTEVATMSKALDDIGIGDS